MKTVANLFATSYERLESDHQQDRQFIRLERLAPEEDSYCTYVKRVDSLAQNEYWIAREKNILMLLKRVPHVARLRKEKEDEKTDDAYQTIKIKDAGISLAHWLGTKPKLASNNHELKHPLVYVQSFLQFARYSLIALKEIHQAGVIHAQLRPDNICIPYKPHPYTFDTPLHLNFNKLCLIDFMFAVSNTLKLSRPLPVHVNQKASTQSALMRHALLSDQHQRHADLITRIDYSVDLYALGFILEQMFQQDLIYPAGLDAELSMEIHRFILELKSYDNGIPESVKLRHLHLHPHGEYLAKIDHLLAISLQGHHPEQIELILDPAHFLEDDLVFNLSPIIENQDNIIKMAEPSDSIQPPLEPVATSALPLATSVEIKTMKETKPSKSLAQTQDHIELSKTTVIALIVTLQVMYVLYADGKNMGLDVFASMGLVAVIGAAVMIAGKMFAPPQPLPKRSVFDDLDDEDNADNTTQTTATVTESSTPTSQAVDELDMIAASVAPAIANNVSAETVSEDKANVTVSNNETTSNTEIEIESVKKEEDNAPPPVMLFNKASEPSKNAKDDEAMEINKWVVIAILIACQLAYVGLTTNFGGSNTAPENAGNSTESAPVESTVEPTPEEIPPTDTTATDDLLAETAPSSESSAANIELLSESSSVSTPQVTTPKTRSKEASSDSMLLSGSPTAETKTKKEKTPTPAKTQESSPAVATTESTDAAKTETPAATPENKTVEVATPATAKDKEMAQPKVEAKTEAKTPSTPKSLTRGLAEAQNAMGWHYYHGDGVPKDLEESFKWFQKAANLGESSAQFNVGMMYQKGEGVKQDLAEAAKWYRKSAEQGKASAQLNLGMMYISGRGVRQNIDEGAKWLSKAADQGDSTAKANLAWLLQQGYIKDAPSGE